MIWARRASTAVIRLFDAPIPIGTAVTICLPLLPLLGAPAPSASRAKGKQVPGSDNLFRFPRKCLLSNWQSWSPREDVQL